MQKLLDALKASKPWHRLTALLGVLALIGVGVVITSDTGPDGTRHTTTTITLGGPGHAKVTLPPAAQQTAQSQAAQDAAGNEQDAHADLRAEPPAAVVPDVLAHDKALKPAGQPTVPPKVPLAAASFPGCRTLLVRNFSSRLGSPVLLFVFHFTVSRDTGWTGVLGNVHWFDNAAAQASSNYIIDRRVGACALTVPESQKAWAQAGFNRVAISVEVTANGSEGSYIPTGPSRTLILRLMHHVHHAWGIPYRHGAVSGCNVARTGFVMHADLGACGGGHVDVRPYGIDDLIAQARRTDNPVSVLDRRRCNRLNRWRAAGRPAKGTHAAILRKHTLIAHKVTCEPGKAAHR